MKSLDRMVTKVLKEVRDPGEARFTKGDVVEGINEAIAIVQTMIVNTNERLLKNLDNGGAPVTVTIPAAATDGASRLGLPSRVSRITQVEVSIGSGGFRTINEMQAGQWQAGLRTYTPTARPVFDMTYQLVGANSIEFWPGVSAAAVNGARLHYESEIPPLLMGTPVIFGTDIRLPSTEDDATGQRQAEQEDDWYNWIQIKIYEGTGLGQVRRIMDYDGVTRQVTPDAAWAPVPNTTSRFAFVSPFRGVMHSIDSLLEVRAAIYLLGTKRHEDVSSFVARYNELEEALKDKLERLSPEPREIIPVDMIEDAAYYG